MSWKKALLVPKVARLARRAPRDTAERWNAYWGAVRATGPGGDVLWDSGSDREGQSYLAQLRRHADPALPLVDVGCGNGRLTRLLAQHSSGALGVDLGPVPQRRRPGHRRGHRRGHRTILRGVRRPKRCRPARWT